MSVIKKIIVFVLFINIVAVPFNIYYLYSYGKVVYFKSEYSLKKVKIKEVLDLSYKDENSSYKGYRVCYLLGDSSYEIEESIDIDAGSKIYEHFIKQGGQDSIFGGHMFPKVNDSIWVWHNKKAIDLYAFGRTDTLDFTSFWLKFGVRCLLIFVAIWSIIYYRKSRIE